MRDDVGFSDMLYMLVRYASPNSPMCFMSLMWTLSFTVELLFLICFIASWTCIVVSVIIVVCSFCVYLAMCLFVLYVLCLTVLVNCLLNAVAFYVSDRIVFPLKVIACFWLTRVWSSKEGVCSVCDPSECLGVPSICQICVFV